MDALKFIVDDIAREQRSSWWMKSIFIIGLFLLPILLGLGMRHGIDDALSARLFIPNLIASLFLIVPPLFYLLKRKQSTAVVSFIFAAFILGLAFSIERILFPLGPITPYPNFEIFFRETTMCFSAGSFSTIVVGSWITFFAYAVSSLPTRNWRAFLSLAAGLSASVMLGFHCDSSSVPHVLLGHVLPGLLFGVLTYWMQNLIFKAKMRRAFPNLDLKNLESK